MSVEVLNKLAEKLGISSASAVKKAEEYYRRCSAKSTLGLANFSDIAKSCALLHIACQELSVPLDKALTTKLSCLKKPSYLKLIHTLRSLLDAGAAPTVSSLCTTLGISELTQPANDLLTKYVKMSPEGSLDASQPVYACAAVLAACKRQRVSVDKTYLKENCRVKWVEVQRIAGEMTEMAKKSSETRKRRNVGADPSEIATEIENKSAKLQDEAANDKKHADVSDETEEDEFEVWKRKILEQAS